MFQVTKGVGYVIQLWAVLLIQSACYFELFVSLRQPIYDMLEELGEYENQLNYILGWPLFIAVNWYYFLACYQHPGAPMLNWNITNPYEGRYCEVCNLSKPTRCSHCKRCRTCVVKRDHHCDFTNQCVGVGNYKSFFWFCFFTMVIFTQFGCMRTGLRSVQWFYHYYYQDLQSVNSVPKWHAILHFIVMNMYFSMMCFTFTMSKNNFQNSLTNCTRMDLLSNMSHPPICSSEVTEPMNNFDMGLCRNWISDFGWNPLMWFYPGRSDDELNTYVGHRFPVWIPLSLDEYKALKGQKIEVVKPNKKRMQAIAEYRAQMFQATIKQNQENLQF